MTRSTHLLPAGLTVSILRLQTPLRPATVRAMIAAELYVLAGQGRATDGSSSYASYIGQSDALQAQATRVGVSLRTWSFRLGRLTPDTIVLVRGSTGPIDPNARLLVEAGLARAISTTHTILNTRTAAPTAARRASRVNRLWALRATDELAVLVRREILRHHPPGPTGGSARERLVRLVLANGPMDVAELVAAAGDSGFPVPGETPQQRSRRDVTTREAAGGRPRVCRTYVAGRVVAYPATMSVRTARAIYQARQAAGAETPTAAP